MDIESLRQEIVSGLSNLEKQVQRRLIIEKMRFCLARIKVMSSYQNKSDYGISPIPQVPMDIYADNEMQIDLWKFKQFLDAVMPESNCTTSIEPEDMYFPGISVGCFITVSDRETHDFLERRFGCFIKDANNDQGGNTEISI